MASCNNDCGSCSSNCADRKAPMDLHEAQNEFSDIKKVIGVVSGKGGVGKSLVTSLLATGLAARGKDTAILDADITGPSIPRMFGVNGRPLGNEQGISPMIAGNGTRIMSMNLLLDHAGDPVVWRGPIIAGTVKQFWTDVMWGPVDCMLVDMPPGTGDVPLTVFQSLPVDGIIIVTSPQELVSMIVEKAMKMAAMMNIPVLGIVENMAYYECPDCHSRHMIFGESHVEELAKKYSIGVTAQIPIDPKIARFADHGAIAELEENWLDPILDLLTK